MVHHTDRESPPAQGVDLPVQEQGHNSVQAMQVQIIPLNGHFAIETSCVYFIQILLRINMVIMIFFPESHL